MWNIDFIVKQLELAKDIYFEIESATGEPDYVAVFNNRFPAPDFDVAYVSHITLHNGRPYTAIVVSDGDSHREKLIEGDLDDQEVDLNIRLLCYYEDEPDYLEVVNGIKLVSPEKFKARLSLLEGCLSQLVQARDIAAEIGLVPYFTSVR